MIEHLIQVGAVTSGVASLVAVVMANRSSSPQPNSNVVVSGLPEFKDTQGVVDMDAALRDLVDQSKQLSEMSLQFSMDKRLRADEVVELLEKLNEIQSQVVSINKSELKSLQSAARP